MTTQKIISDVLAILQTFTGDFAFMLTLSISSVVFRLLVRIFADMGPEKRSSSETDSGDWDYEHIEGTDTWYYPSDYDYIEDETPTS